MPASERASQVAMPTIETALTNAARLLHAAELETNLATMERLEKLADSWTAIASLLIRRSDS